MNAIKIFAVSAVRASSASGINNASNEQKPHLISPKDEPTSSSSWNADKQPHIVSENLPDSLTQRESINQGEKTKDISSSRSRPASTPGLKGVVCQKCKDIGHSADCCTVTSPRASFTESSTAKSIKEDMNAGSKLKAAIQAAMLKKPGIYRKRKIADQSDGLSMSNGDENCDMPSCDQILSKTHNVISDEGALEGKVNLGMLSTKFCKSTNVNNAIFFFCFISPMFIALCKIGCFRTPCSWCCKVWSCFCYYILSYEDFSCS